MKKFIFAILAIIIFMLPFIVNAQTKDSVAAKQKSFAEAIVKSDWKMLETFCHKDLIYTHSFGRVDTKDDFLRNIAKLKVELWDNDNMIINIYKNTAIVRSNLKVKLFRPDGEVQLSDQRATDVWLWEKRRWLLVSHQSTSFKS
jgi:ketosteroid isomerase-like protein